MDPTDSQLVAYLTGVLDPGRVVALEAELHARPELRRRLQALETVRRRPGRTARSATQRTYLPPAGGHQRWVLVAGRPDELAHLSPTPEPHAFLRLTAPDSTAQLLVHAEHIKLPEDR